MSGSEAGTTALAAVLMDPDLLVGAGMHAGAQLLSLPKILLDCELFRYCLHVRSGLRVDEGHLMTDVIARVGPGGHYLGAKETRRHLRAGAVYRPRLLLREPPDALGEEAADEVDRAVEAVEEILASHRPPPLPEGADEAMADVIAEAGGTLEAR
jgi:trimethylamine--corrinoid protein Co-methyltransferase